MTPRDVVAAIAKDRMVETIIRRITDNSKDDQLNDLAADIYLQLLEDDRTVGLYERKQLNFYICRVVMNNICSSTSPYFWKYKRPQKIEQGGIPIPDVEDGD